LIVPSYVDTNTFLSYLQITNAVKSSSKLSDIAYNYPFLRSKTPRCPSLEQETSIFPSELSFISITVPSCSSNDITQAFCFYPANLKSHILIIPSSSPVAIIAFYSICLSEFIGQLCALASLPSSTPFDMTPMLPSADPVNTIFPSGENSTYLHDSV
jgi:hypothetical protein